MQKQFVDDIISNKLGPLKPALSHVGLYAGLVIYTAVGAMVSDFSLKIFFVVEVEPHVVAFVISVFSLPSIQFCLVWVAPELKPTIKELLEL